MNKMLAVLALVSVILLAGCTSKVQQAAAGNGVEITFFNAPSQVDADETFSADLVAQNNGDAEALSIRAELFQKSNFDIMDEEQIKRISSLSPPVLEKGVSGEELVASWIVRAPEVASDQIKSLGARVTYDYSSSANSNLYIVPKEQYDELGAESFATYSTSSNAPVLISIQPLPAFKIRQGEDNVDVLVVLNIENTGNGVVVGSRIQNFKLLFKAADAVNDKTFSCSNVLESREVQLLGRNQGISLRCKTDLTAPKASVSYIVEASADYTYYTDSEPISITVKK